MKLIISLYLFLFHFGVFVIAQNNNSLQQAKFNLIKNAVWFYSKDTKAGWKNSSDCNESKEINSLIDCAKGMQGVNSNLAKWNSIQITNLEELKKFDEKISQNISSSKDYRKEMPEFKIFQSQSHNIISYIENELSKPPVAQGDIAKPKIEKENSPDDDKESADKKGENSKPWNLWLLLSFFLSFLSILISFLLFKGFKNEIEKLSSKISSSKKNDDNFDITTKINFLENELKSFDGSIDTLREEFSTKIKNITGSLATKILQTNSPTQNIPIDTNKFNPSVKYAKYADKGDGFSTNELLDSTDNDTIFEIKITSNNTAKFRISSNRDAQRYALTNPNYFFNREPEFTNTRIQLVQYILSTAQLYDNSAETRCTTMMRNEIKK